MTLLELNDGRRDESRHLIPCSVEVSSFNMEVFRFPQAAFDHLVAVIPMSVTNQGGTTKGAAGGVDRWC